MREILGRVSVNILGRSTGHNAVASAAYRACEKLRDEQTQNVIDYTRKKGLHEVMIITPDNAPAWMQNRQALWNAVEVKENSHSRKATAQLSREFLISLPREFTPEQGRAVVLDYVHSELVSKGMVADIAFHDMDSHNPHAHVMTTMRKIEGESFGKKCTDWNNPKNVDHWRKAWEDTCNHHLQQAGIDAYVDLRSNAEKENGRIPQPKLGRAVIEMDKRGIETAKMAEFKRVQQLNDELNQQRQQAIDALARLEEEIRHERSLKQQARRLRRQRKQRNKNLRRNHRPIGTDKLDQRAVFFNRKEDAKRKAASQVRQKRLAELHRKFIKPDTSRPYEKKINFLKGDPLKPTPEIEKQSMAKRQETLEAAKETTAHVINARTPKQTSRSDKELEHTKPFTRGTIADGKAAAVPQGVPPKGEGKPLKKLSRLGLQRLARILAKRYGYSRERLQRTLTHRAETGISLGFIRTLAKRAYAQHSPHIQRLETAKMQATAEPPSRADIIYNNLNSFRSKAQNLAGERRPYNPNEQYISQLSRKIAKQNLRGVARSYSQGQKIGIKRDMRIAAEMYAHGYSRGEIEASIRACSPNMIGKTEGQRRRYLKTYLERVYKDPRTRVMKQEVEKFRQEQKLGPEHRRIDLMDKWRGAITRGEPHRETLKRESEMSDRNFEEKKSQSKTYDQYLKETRGYGRQKDRQAQDRDPANDNQRNPQPRKEKGPQKQHELGRDMER